MSSLKLLVIADPTAPFLGPLSRLRQDVQVVISDDPEKLKSLAPDADALLFAHFDGDLLANVLPLANRVRWIHCLWTGVEMILKQQIIVHPATLTNGRGVFRWPLADGLLQQCFSSRSTFGESFDSRSKACGSRLSARA